MRWYVVSVAREGDDGEGEGDSEERDVGREGVKEARRDMLLVHDVWLGMSIIAQLSQRAHVSVGESNSVI